MEQNQSSKNSLDRKFVVQDVFNEIDKQVSVDVTKEYDPLYFWEDFGDRYYKSFRTPKELSRNVGWLIGRLKSLNISNVLELGCGFGRIAPFLLESEAIKDYTGIDISPKQLASSKAYLSSNVDNVQIDPLVLKDKTPEEIKILETQEKQNLSKKLEEFSKHIKLEKMSTKRTSYAPESFDCVISVDTLGTMPLSSARYALIEARRVSKRFVVLVERYIYPGEHPQPHAWSHDYYDLALNTGFRILENKLIGQGVIGLTLEK